MVTWSKEKLATYSTAEIQSLRDNALRLEKEDVAALCEDELAARKPARFKKNLMSTHNNHNGQYVSEFHFVCPNELGVTRNTDGTIWTGTWVVAESHAETAVKKSAFVALHAARTSPSYMQGVVLGWRRSLRQARYTGNALTQTGTGIDFLVRPSETPLKWVGDATGEKGYAWLPVNA
jgi:hypothetical protein